MPCNLCIIPIDAASMKVPARRRGNPVLSRTRQKGNGGLNESPHPKVGKSRLPPVMVARTSASLNESPHPKVGKFLGCCEGWVSGAASMKVPTRRWGNIRCNLRERRGASCLNESPHPKVGKFRIRGRKSGVSLPASMKVPTRRWGNFRVYGCESGGVPDASMKVPTRRWGN